ncbi:MULTISPECIES: hypothetical protein [unclassified Aeromicrobium]|uniref:hypothetical protein n=1 Tax=unclassified Aeromicrobium TaxID=2633570 RepID=UPI00288A9A01|nr:MULTISPECIES: hypothetical protein [unclassified Aeromicrobium]
MHEVFAPLANGLYVLAVIAASFGSAVASLGSAFWFSDQLRVRNVARPARRVVFVLAFVGAATVSLSIMIFMVHLANRPPF